MRAAILLSLCAATGCGGPEVALLTWDTIDLDDVQAKLAAPTATVSDFEEGIAKIGDELGDLEILGGEGFDLYEAIDDPNETAPTVYESSGDQTTGTQAYMAVACSGPDGDGPDPDFAFGSVRFDGPTIQYGAVEEGESVSVAGPIYLTFDDCRVRDVLMTGGIPGYYDDVANRLGMDGELRIDLVEEDRILRNGPVIIYQDAKQTAVAWFIVPERYGVARAVSGSGFTSFGVELSDGSATCTWGDGLSCETTKD
jgi:hypothetical protein